MFHSKYLKYKKKYLLLRGGSIGSKRPHGQLEDSLAKFVKIPIEDSSLAAAHTKDSDVEEGSVLAAAHTKDSDVAAHTQDIDLAADIKYSGELKTLLSNINNDNYITGFLSVNQWVVGNKTVTMYGETHTNYNLGTYNKCKGVDDKKNISNIEVLYKLFKGTHKCIDFYLEENPKETVQLMKTEELIDYTKEKLFKTLPMSNLSKIKAIVYNDIYKIKQKQFKNTRIHYSDFRPILIHLLMPSSLCKYEPEPDNIVISKEYLRNQYIEVYKKTVNGIEVNGKIDRFKYKEIENGEMVEKDEPITPELLKKINTRYETWRKKSLIELWKLLTVGTPPEVLKYNLRLRRNILDSLLDDGTFNNYMSDMSTFFSLLCIFSNQKEVGIENKITYLYYYIINTYYYNGVEQYKYMPKKDIIRSANGCINRDNIPNNEVEVKTEVTRDIHILELKQLKLYMRKNFDNFSKIKSQNDKDKYLTFMNIHINFKDKYNKLKTFNIFYDDIDQKRKVMQTILSAFTNLLTDTYTILRSLKKFSNDKKDININSLCYNNFDNNNVLYYHGYNHTIVYYTFWKYYFGVDCTYKLNVDNNTDGNLLNLVYVTNNLFCINDGRITIENKNFKDHLNDYIYQTLLIKLIFANVELKKLFKHLNISYNLDEQCIKNDGNIFNDIIKNISGYKLIEEEIKA